MHLYLLRQRLKWYSFTKQTTKRSPCKVPTLSEKSRTFPPVASKPLCQCKVCSNNSCSGRMVQVTCSIQFHPWGAFSSRLTPSTCSWETTSSFWTPRKTDHATRSAQKRMKHLQWCADNSGYHEESENCIAYDQYQSISYLCALASAILTCKVPWTNMFRDTFV